MRQQSNSIASLVSKDKVVAALTRKALESDDKARQTEKAILKGELDFKSGLSQFIKQKCEVHQNEIMKVKVL